MNQSPLTTNETIEAAIEAASAVGAAESGPATALSAAQRHRLVKAAKCPTPIKRRNGLAKPGFNQWGLTDQLAALESGQLHTVTSPQGDPVAVVGGVSHLTPETVTVAGTRADFGHLMRTGEIKTAKHKADRGTVAVISKRDWSNEWRIRTETDQPHGLPPEQAGARYTETLSLSGARKLADSCHFMALKKGGYSTFLTLTFDEAGRQRVADRRSDAICTEIKWEKGKAKPLVTWLESGRDMTFGSIQKEASRFFDAIQKTYQRGWVNDHEEHGTGNKLPGHDDKLCYCWVAENPKNERGQDNPHLHVLMRWRVPYLEFLGWAARVESQWGQGWARLEKIKEPEKAGAYMAKAAGYMTKAQGATDQGRIRGNRYGISAASRAPDWECVGRYDAGIMGSLIADAHDYFSHLYGRHFAERKQLNQKLADTPKGHPKRHAIGAKLEKVRSILNKLPAVISKYQITFKNGGAASEFLTWARDDTGTAKPDWLPAKEAGDAWSDAREAGEITRHPKTPGLFGRRFNQRQQAKAVYLENQRRRRWDRWTGGDHWWSAVRDWFGRFELVNEFSTDSRWERQNWGFC